MDTNPQTGRPYKHEDYSAAVIRFLMKDVIRDHKFNENYHITADEIADFLNQQRSAGRSLIWKDLVSSQLDADRADYLLRDSHHIGVAYGRYDLERLLNTLTIAIDEETTSPTLAVEDDGVHAVEALIIARYMMFTQVYFHRTRRAYDRHATLAIKELLRKHQAGSLPNPDVFPPPTSLKNIEAYLTWDDWRVQGMICSGLAGDHGDRLLNRDHYRCVYETPEQPRPADADLMQQIQQRLGTMPWFLDTAEKSWYKFEKADEIEVLLRPGLADETLVPLGIQSAVVHGLKAVNQSRVYVTVGDRPLALSRVIELRDGQ